MSADVTYHRVLKLAQAFESDHGDTKQSELFSSGGLTVSVSVSVRVEVVAVTVVCWKKAQLANEMLPFVAKLAMEYVERASLETLQGSLESSELWQHNSGPSSSGRLHTVDVIVDVSAGSVVFTTSVVVRFLEHMLPWLV